jgi:hypothetical protein
MNESYPFPAFLPSLSSLPPHLFSLTPSLRLSLLYANYFTLRSYYTVLPAQHTPFSSGIFDAPP